MSIHFVSYEVHPENIDDVEAGVKQIIAALEREQPESVRYLLAKQPDGAHIVGFLGLSDGTDNPLLSIPEAQEFQRKLANWIVGEPARPRPLEVLGSYSSSDGSR